MVFGKLSIGSIVLSSLTLAVALLACGGDAAHEGKSCATGDDCGGNLTCQPIGGHDQTFCCPTPAAASGEDNCHATKK
jgi:hypothetical protein